MATIGFQQLVYGVDLVGTAAFAASGALRAMERRPDFVGMLILAGATAVGGSVLRDVMLDRDVVFLRDWRYPLVILLATLAVVRFPASVLKRERALRYFDALGLGTFTAFTASAAWKAGVNPLSILAVATACGCAGGVVRDVIIRRDSLVLATEVYVTAAMAGAAALMATSALGAGESAALAAAFATTTGLRFAAILFDWRLPRIIPVKARQGDNLGSLS